MKQPLRFLAALILSACHPSFSANPEQAEAAARAGVRRFPIAINREDGGEYTGLSGLTIDASGHFWAVPERQRALLRLNLTHEKPGLPGLDDAPIPLDGVPDGMDTEALVWLSEGHFAMGTETQEQSRGSDAVLFAQVEGGRARVTRSITLPYRLWHLRARANDGIEGLCFAGGRLLAGVETTGTTAAGERFAPLGRYDLVKGTWTAFSLVLTSRIGKISALACRMDKGATNLEVLAIERNIGISHLLRFAVPVTGPGGIINPDVWVDFGQVIDAVPNLEGVTWSPEGDIFAISDNDFGIVTGPTQIVVIPRSWR